MRHLNKGESNFCYRGNGRSSQTFELRQIRYMNGPSQPRRKPRRLKYFIYGILILWMLSLFGAPALTGLMVIFSLLFILHRQSSRASIGYHRMTSLPENGSTNRPVAAAQPSNPELVDKEIRDAGGIINYINYRNWRQTSEPPENETKS